MFNSLRDFSPGKGVSSLLLDDALKPAIVLYLVYRPVCKMVLTEFLSGIKFVGP